MPDSTASAPVQLAVRGPFELAASVRFLEGFAPAHRPDAAAEPGLLRLAFPADDGWAPVGAAVRQRDGVTTVELTGALGDHHEAVAAQVARILSLDVDGSGFADVGRRARGPPRRHPAPLCQHRRGPGATDPDPGHWTVLRPARPRPRRRTPRPVPHRRAPAA